jgi:HAD superfamily hydrolase (TIGR01509 family)
MPRAGKLGPTFGIPTEKFKPLWKAHRKKIVRGELTFRNALHEIGAQLNVPIDSTTVDRVCEERLRAVVSNSMAEDVAAWHECALAPQFSTALFSHAVGMAKPDRDIYLEAARRLGTDPGGMVFVGDTAVEDLVGAQSAGLHAVCSTWFLPPGVDPPGLEQVPLVSRPRELLELLRQ